MVSGALRVVFFGTPEFAVPTPDSVPTSITTGPDARLWFTEQGAGQIGAFRP